MKKIAAIVVAILAVILWFGLFGGQEPASSDAYGRCVEQLMKEGQEKNQGRLPSKLNRDLAEAGCKIVKTSCEKDPEGAVCQALVEKYGGEAP